MKLKEILTIPGRSGLYKLIATTKNNFIVEALEDGKRQSLAINHKVSLLGDIYIYTKEEEVPLADVLKKISEADDGKLSINPNAEPEELRKYFRELIPNIDEERVHASHMKKMLTWYQLLNGKIDFSKQEEEGEDDGSLNLPDSGEKQHHKVHESHAPKADQHAKVAPVKLRKKV